MSNSLITAEAFNVASAALKYASKTNVKEAAAELERLFYSPAELHKLHHIRDMLHLEPGHSLNQSNTKN